MFNRDLAMILASVFLTVAGALTVVFTLAELFAENRGALALTVMSLVGAIAISIGLLMIYGPRRK